MFRIVCYPSSGSIEYSSQTVVTYTHTHTTGLKLGCQTPIKHMKNFSELLRISVKYSSIFPHDGPHTIRNMSE